MKLIIRYLSLSGLIIFNLFITQYLHAQSFEETINFADNQFKSGNYAASLKTYQRALFFSEGRENLYLFSQIAEISYHNEDYETAQKYFGLAYNQSGNDSLKTELLFNKAACQMLNKKFQLALIDLLSVNDTTESVQRRLNFYLGTCYFGLEDFKNAQTFFSYCVKVEDLENLTALFSDKNLLKPSPRKAKIMSMIIPGLGQTYSGEIKSGLNSLLLTSGLIALGINISVRYKPIDAVFTILPWYQRYYTGGYGNAEEIARRKRQNKRNDIYNIILELVSENSIES